VIGELEEELGRIHQEGKEADEKEGWGRTGFQRE
jgi:hypothetical protein